MMKCYCIKCKNEVSIAQLSNHYDSRQCKRGRVGFKKMVKVDDSLECHFCNKLCKNKNSYNNHVRCCPKNANRNYKNGMSGKTSSRKGKTKETDESIMRQSITYRNNISSGKTIVVGRPVSDKTREKQSIIACTRLAKHSKYSKNVEYKPGIILESSYEVRAAEILDELNIEWLKVRQGYIWNDNGKKRRYVPDFYLPKQNIFLDPKNDYLIKKDRLKIKSAMELNNIIVVVLSKEQLTKEYVKTLVL